jgi:hypothetical protein
MAKEGYRNAGFNPDTRGSGDKTSFDQEDSMKGKSTICVVAGIFIFAALAAGAGQLPSLAKMTVQSVSDAHPKLTVGSSPVTIRLNGQNLGLATGCAVLLNGVVVRDITVAMGTATATSRPITLTVNAGLTSSRSGYQLRMMSKAQVLDVPVSIFVMDVMLPARTTTAVALPAVTRAYPPPNVDITRVPSEARAGREITFWGRDFIPDRFQATIGSNVLVQLQITYRSTNQMRARLPEQKLVGPLVVSHGTDGSRVQVKASFTVYGHPVITSVTPSSFKRGDWVELKGQDLNRAQPLTYTTASVNPWIMIADVPPSAGRETMVSAESWTSAADGTSARFRAGISYTQASALTGKLRLWDPEDRDFGVASPSAVNWTSGVAFIIDSVHPYLKWNNQNVDFILLQAQTSQNILIAKGTGILDDMRAKMGTVGLETHACSGSQGEFRVPYTATTNFVQFTRAGSTVQSPAPIRVGIWPKWDPSAPQTMRIVLNTEYAVRGWGLKPTGIAGLVYSLDFVFSAGMPLRVQVLEHTENQIRFKVVTTAPLPSNYMTYNEFNSQIPRQFHLNGRYQNGAAMSLINRLYYLVNQ